MRCFVRFFFLPFFIAAAFRKRSNRAERLATEASCHTTIPDEACYKDAMWALAHGIHENPKNYPGLSNTSTLADFQLFLHNQQEQYKGTSRMEGVAKCPRPCTGGKFCHTAVEGDLCYKDVLWAKQEGIHSNPDWYPGLTKDSSFEEFQLSIFKTGKNPKCGDSPCVESKEESSTAAAATTATTASSTAASNAQDPATAVDAPQTPTAEVVTPQDDAAAANSDTATEAATTHTSTAEAGPSTWSYDMPVGTMPVSSDACTTYNDFRQTVAGSHLSVSAGGETRMCTSATEILTAFRSGVSGSWTCNGETWFVGDCGTGIEISVGNSIMSMCSCSNNQIVIRPCMGNANWGGYATSCNSQSITLSITVSQAATTQSPTPKSAAVAGQLSAMAFVFAVASFI